MSEAPMLPGLRFNPEALYLALDRQRRQRRISWRQVSRECDMRNVQLGPRLGRGSTVHADTLIRLMGWLGQTDITPYVHQPSLPDETNNHEETARS